MIRNTILAVAVLVLSFKAYAQSPTLDERKAAADAVYGAFSIYSSTTDFKELGVTGFSQAESDRFDSLFIKGAIVHDDLTPASLSDFTTSDKAVEQYEAGIRENFPQGINVKINKANINFKRLGERVVEVAVERSVNGKYKGNNLFQNKESTLILSYQLSEDYKTARIASITKVSGTLQCVDCPVAAAAVTAKKETPPTAKKEPAKETAKPKEPETVVIKETATAAAAKPKPETTTAAAKPKEPVQPVKPKQETTTAAVTKPKEPANKVVVSDVKTKKTESSVGFALGLHFAGGGNAGLSKPDLAGMNYDEFVSATGDAKKGAGASFSAGLEADILFGKKKNTGIAIGFMYNYSASVLKYDAYQLRYKGSNGNNAEVPANFLRILNVRDVKEKISTNTAAIDLLFKYQSPNRDKVGFYIHAGPVIAVSSTAKSKYSASVNYEAVYQNRNGQFVFDNTGTVGSNDFILTEEFLLSKGNTAEATKAYFDRRRSYNVALDQEVSGKSDAVKYKVGFGGLLRAGAAIPVGKAFSVQVGANLMLLSASRDIGSKVLTDEIGKYNSVLNASKAGANMNFGIHLGLVYKIL